MQKLNNYQNQIIPSKTIKSHKFGVSNPSVSRSIHTCTAHHDELLASTLCLFTKLRSKNWMPRAVETDAHSIVHRALIPWTTGWISSNFLTLLSNTMSNLPALVSKEALQTCLDNHITWPSHDTQIAETAIRTHSHLSGIVRWLLQWLSSTDPVACDPHSGQSRPDAWQPNMDATKYESKKRSQLELVIAHHMIVFCHVSMFPNVPSI